jgi:hypothetical protein
MCIFGAKIEELIEPWRKIPNEELHNLKFSPNIIRVIERKRVRQAGLKRRREMRSVDRI